MCPWNIFCISDPYDSRVLTQNLVKLNFILQSLTKKKHFVIKAHLSVKNNILISKLSLFTDKTIVCNKLICTSILTVFCIIGICLNVRSSGQPWSQKTFFLFFRVCVPVIWKFWPKNHLFGVEKSEQREKNTQAHIIQKKKAKPFFLKKCFWPQKHFFERIIQKIKTLFWPKHFF